MTPAWDRRVRLGCALMASFCAGALADGLLRMKYIRAEPGTRDVAALRLPSNTSAADAARVPASARPAVVPVAATTGVVPEGRLRMPIDGVKVESLKGGFEERRGGRPHEAIDILAPRHTPVLAVESGTIAKLFVSNAGGITIYQFDPSGRIAYYYAHLERYADGLHEGQAVVQGDVIGYVGTTGNAPPDTPHLHFAVFELDDTRRWWKGKAIDPYQVFKEKG
jgi:peptidoglycan LD-endopeptidase LytH